MSKFKEKMEAANLQLVCLKHVKVITKSDLVFPEWIFLNEEYKENQDSSWQTKALISITNSLITQRRVFFTLTSRSFREMVKDDKNWVTPIGLDNNAWKDLIGKAFHMKMFKIVKEIKVKGKKRVLFELIDVDILNLILVDKVKQEKEAMLFIQGLEILEESTLPDSTPEQAPELVLELVKVIAVEEVLEAESKASVLSSIITKENTNAVPALAVDTEKESSQVLVLVDQCLKLKLSEFELSFVSSIPDKLIKYKTLTEKQTALLNRIAAKLPKPKITPEAATAILNSSTDVSIIVGQINQYSYEKSKNGLAQLLNSTKTLTSQQKNEIGKALNIQPPKAANTERYEGRYEDRY